MLNRFLATAAIATNCVLVPTLTQAATIQFDLEGIAGSRLLPGNEVPGASGTGSGGEIGEGIFFDNQTNVLTLNFGWGSTAGFDDLTGPATVGHIHSPADQSGTGPVIFDLLGNGPNVPGNARVDVIFNDSGDAGGTVIGTINYTDDEAADLLAGLNYINIHSAANPGGEVRGNLIVSVPESSDLIGFAMAGLGLLGLFGYRRRSATHQ